MRKASVLVVAIGLVVGACGGDGDDDQVAAAPVVVQAEPAATTPPEEAETGATGDTDTAEPADASADNGTETDYSSLSDEERALQFVACMRDEGVDFPDPVVNADGSIDFLGNATPGSIDPTTDVFAAAVEVCGEIVAGASFLPGADIDEVEQQELLLAFAQCLRDQGFDVVDPVLADIQNGGPGALAQAFGPNFDPTDPANADAVAVCQAEVNGGDNG